MAHSLFKATTLRATTALTVTLSMALPGPIAAQSLIVPPGPVARLVGGPDRIWQVQTTCDDDPTLPECVTPAPVPEAAAPEPVVPEVIPAPEAAPAPVPEAVVPEPEVVAPAPEPQAAPQTTEPAPVAVEPEPQQAVTPEAPTEETSKAPAADALPAPDAAAPVLEEAPLAAPEAAPAETVDEPQAMPPAAQEPMTAEPQAAPATDPEAVAPPAEAAPMAEPEAVPAAAPEADAATPTTEPTAAPVADATTDPVSVPDPVVEPTPEQAQVLENMMADPNVAAAVDTLSQTVAPPAATGDTVAAPADAAANALGALLGGGAAPAPAETTTQTLGAAEARSSAQDFGTKLATTAPTEVKKKDKLSDLEKAGLVALGAVAVGMLINHNRVVANSGDRVVVDRGNGDLAVWKDDNANLRAPGVVETTQRYGDGSTLSTLERPDGSQIITVRDATGRVLRRDRIDVNGRRVPIIDDTRPARPVFVRDLPAPRVRELRLADDADPALMRALLDNAEQPDLGRTFSLAQVRDIREVRSLAPELTGAPITFATGSSAIRPDEAGKLARLGQLMAEMIADNPSEVFLIEGHTDAVGGAAYNLALSDRRAESVALALTEIFGVPAENMVVQGYGERYLKVASNDDEPRNRRVALRRITWLVDGQS